MYLCTITVISVVSRLWILVYNFGHITVNLQVLVAKGSICVFHTDLNRTLDKVSVGPDPGTHLRFVALTPQNDANNRKCYILYHHHHGYPTHLTSVYIFLTSDQRDPLF
jgi:hypothetical protein